MAFADSSSAPVLLASATLSGNTGDSLVLRLAGDEMVLAAIPADELLTVEIDGVPFTMALRDAAAGAVVHRFIDARPVAVRYSINRRIQRALRGSIALTQVTAARVVELQTPWVWAAALARGAHLDIAPGDPQCTQMLDVSQNATYCGVAVFIDPWASADAFLEHGATFQSDPGHGQSRDIFISFVEPVQKVEITAHDVTWGGNRVTVYDSTGLVLKDELLPGNNTPGVYSTAVVTAAAPDTGAGITTVKLATVVGEYIAYSMKVQFKKDNGCKVPATLYGQGTIGSTWRDSIYDGGPKKIWNLGCALTSMAMGMSAHGTIIDPGQLNHLMKITPGGFDGTKVTWETDIIAASKSSANKLTMNRFTSRDEMKKQICAGNPVIVGVKPKEDTTNRGHFYPGHWVLVNEVKPDGSFYIQDPAGNGSIRPLTDYTGTQWVKGAIVKRPAAPAPTVNMRSTVLATVAASEPLPTPLLNISARRAGVTVTATDGTSSVVGGSGPDTAGIPGSIVATEGIDDDVDTLSLDTSLLYTVSVPAVTGAQYSVEVLPRRLGLDTLLINMPSSTGTDQEVQLLPYFGVPGRPVQFMVSVTPDGMAGTRTVTGGVFIVPFCGLKHEIINVNSTPVEASYLIEETGETGTVTLAARGAKQFFSLTELTTTTRGTLRLTVNGKVIARMAARTTCEHPEG